MVKILSSIRQQALIEGIFLERRNRFVGLVEIGGVQQAVHITNTGRMRELLLPGARVLLKPAANPLRKTQFSLHMVFHNGIWVALESTAANVLVYEALRHRELSMFTGYHNVRREVGYGGSRFDAALSGEGPTCYIEVKCCTLVVNGEARFPDAPTERGRKHVEELARAVRAGQGGAVIFVAQRPDAQRFRPNDATDPRFGAALRLAHGQGVKVLAFSCGVTPQELSLGGEIPVDLSREMV